MKRLFLPLLGFLSLVLMYCNDNKESGTVPMTRTNLSLLTILRRIPVG